MGIGAAVGGIASGVGGLLGSSASKQASQQQTQMGMLSLIAQIQAQQQAREDQAPWRNVGTGAENMLGSLYGINPDGTTGNSALQSQAMSNFTNTPDYQFAYNQGLQAVDRSMAAKGLLGSGGALKGVTEFGQGLASQQFGNYYNRLLSLSQLGQSAASGTAANTLASANSIANTLGNIGTAQASGTVGSTNALTSALGNIGTYGALGASSYGNLLGNGNWTSNAGSLTNYNGQAEMPTLWS